MNGRPGWTAGAKLIAVEENHEVSALGGGIRLDIFGTRGGGR
jgi:hypothetical protein